MSDKDGIWVPAGMATVLMLAVAIICCDMIADVVTGIQEGGSVVNIIMRGLAALGWGLVVWYMASELWQWRKRRKKKKDKGLKNDE